MITIEYWVKYGIASGGWERDTLDMPLDDVQKLIKNQYYIKGDTFGSEAHIISID